MQKVKRAYLNYDVLRSECIKRCWFTGGTNQQYQKLFDLNAAGASSRDLALCIWLCTDLDTLESIQQVIQHLHATTGAGPVVGQRPL